MISRRQAAIGVVFWLLIFGGFVALAGVGDFIETASQISPSRFAVMLGANGLGVLAMGLALYVIAHNVGLGFSAIESVFLNTTVGLAHNLTPFGQAGGIPVSGAILSRQTDRPYEECLAVLSAKDIVGFVPAILVFVVGGGYLALFGRSVPGRLRPLVAAFSLFVVIVVSVAALIYRYPEPAYRVLSRLVAWINRTVARLPLIPSLDPTEVQTTTTAVGSQGILLWLTLGGVGVELSPVLTVFIIPVSLLASGLPLPGGSGGVESLQVLLVVAASGAAASTVITAVLVSRGLVYWTPIIMGSITLFVIEVRDRLA
ncbi:hypothetical protein BRC62_07505 [Halobacteriales archaeon QH_10_67_13]|nr:MAG: hypothetical protein BRC62_07505 [Halobacteriales archaeon QH_10_67_13]